MMQQRKSEQAFSTKFSSTLGQPPFPTNFLPASPVRQQTMSMNGKPARPANVTREPEVISLSSSSPCGSGTNFTDRKKNIQPRMVPHQRPVTQKK
jgi:hypothetical protein